MRQRHGVEKANHKEREREKVKEKEGETQREKVKSETQRERERARVLGGRRDFCSPILIPLSHRHLPRVASQLEFVVIQLQALGVSTALWTSTGWANATWEIGTAGTRYVRAAPLVRAIVKFTAKTPYVRVFGGSIGGFLCEFGFGSHEWSCS